VPRTGALRRALVLPCVAIVLTGCETLSAEEVPDRAADASAETAPANDASTEPPFADASADATETETETETGDTGDRCSGKVCDQPPAPFCKDGTTRVTHAALGTCEAGACTYARSEETCALGCASGACKVKSPPQILALASNVGTLRPRTPLVVTAVVTDPDGIRDVIGGTLSDPDSGGTYGAFATSSDEGAYSLTLNWSSVDTVRTIEFPAPAGKRVLRATFFDAAGERTTKDLEIAVRCERDADSACGGICVDTQTSPQHCGRCRAPVAAPRVCIDGTPTCTLGRTYCAVNNSCSDLYSDPANCGACGRAVQNGTCVGGAPSCRPSHGICSDSPNTCVSLIDTNNCYRCGRACDAGEECDRNWQDCRGLRTSTTYFASCRALCRSFDRNCTFDPINKFGTAFYYAPPNRYGQEDLNCDIPVPREVRVGTNTIPFSHMTCNCAGR
jgi:hypothetical protein